MCNVCEQGIQVDVMRGQVAEPTNCISEGCGARGQMVLSHNLSVFCDKQLVKLQETPDAIPEGETPHTVNLLAYDDLVDVGKPGSSLLPSCDPMFFG